MKRKNITYKRSVELVKKLWDLTNVEVMTPVEMRKIHKRILKKVI